MVRESLCDYLQNIYIQNECLKLGLSKKKWEWKKKLFDQTILIAGTQSYLSHAPGGGAIYFD